MRLGKAHWTTFGEDKALFEGTPFTLYDYDHIGFFFLFFFFFWTTTCFFGANVQTQFQLVWDIVCLLTKNKKLISLNIKYLGFFCVFNSI